MHAVAIQAKARVHTPTALSILVNDALDQILLIIIFIRFYFVCQANYLK
jgi:hypothetical protein